MKRLSIIIGLLLLCSPLFGGWPQKDRPLLRFGAEWGSGTRFFLYRNLNYSDPDLGRIWDEWADYSLSLNAYAYISAGLEPLSWLSLSINTGVMGVSSGRRVIPLELRASLYPKKAGNDGPFVFVGGGLGFPDYFTKAPLSFINVGSGYRLALDSLWDLDLLLHLRICKDAPPIWDEDKGVFINENYVRGNTAIYISAQFGISISF